MINVLFFGAAASAAGERETVLSPGQRVSAAEVFEQILAEFPGLKGHKLLLAVNQEYARGEEIVKDGDELAVFTPVSGG